MNTDVLIKPIITEKSTHDAGKGKFTFLVANGADKNVIKQAVEKMFNVHVVDVATVIIKGRTKRTGQKRIEVTLPSFKKGIVTLKSGEKISLFDTSVQG